MNKIYCTIDFKFIKMIKIQYKIEFSDFHIKAFLCINQNSHRYNYIYFNLIYII